MVGPSPACPARYWLAREPLASKQLSKFHQQPMGIENQIYNKRAFRKANEKARILVLSTTRYHWIGYYPMEVSRWDAKKLFLDTAWWKQRLGHGKDPKGASNIFDWKSREQKKIWCKCDGQSSLSPFKTLPFGRVFFLNHNVHHQNCHALGVYTHVLKIFRHTHRRQTSIAPDSANRFKAFRRALRASPYILAPSSVTPLRA